jgi:hypothetical protein
MLSAEFASTGGTMVFFVLATLFSWLIDLGTLRFQSGRDKELEILLLRRQLAILQRTQPRPPRLTRWEKLGLAMLVGKLRFLPTTARVRAALRVIACRAATSLEGNQQARSRSSPTSRGQPGGAEGRGGCVACRVHSTACAVARYTGNRRNASVVLHPARPLTAEAGRAQRPTRQGRYAACHSRIA